MPKNYWTDELEQLLIHNYGQFTLRSGEDGRKNLFFTVFEATETPSWEDRGIDTGGELIGDEFNDKFSSETNSQITPQFITGGSVGSVQAVNAVELELPELNNFQAEDNTIKYARLGRLMSSGVGMDVGYKNQTEINFIGNGRIRGYIINMKDTDYTRHQILELYKNIIYQGLTIYEADREVYKT